MNLTRKGLLLAATQLVIVLSLGAKLLYDRATRPRVWAQADNFDPDLPIRGRYLALRLPVIPEGFTYEASGQPNIDDWSSNQNWAYLSVRANQLIGSAQGAGSGMWIHLHKNGDGPITALTEDFVLVFIPETFQMPTVHHDDQLWVEVTIPAKVPPRPIRIAIKNASGFKPLHFN